MKYLLNSVIMFIITGSITHAQIVTDRPDQTESSSTIESGSLQIESGVLITFTEDDFSSQSQLLAPTNLFRYGLLKGIEIRVLSQFESVKDQMSSKKVTGISDLEIGTKIQIFKKESVNTEIAFISHLVLPTGSKILSNKKFGSISKLSMSHQITNNLGLGYNVGYNYFGSGKGDLTYSLALGIGVTNTFSFYLEPFGSILDIESLEANFDAGITYLIKDNCQLDFSFGTGINNTMNYLSLGFSINIAKSN